MIGTETKLWAHMRRAPAFAGFERIESPITPGASDVVYVGNGATGWLELKTAKWPRAGKPLRLRCEFSVTQAQWLIDHHKPKISLYSWLLIGIIGPATWTRFLLCDAPAALVFMEGRPRPPLDEVLVTYKSIRVFDSINDVITRIRS